VGGVEVVEEGEEAVEVDVLLDEAGAVAQILALPLLVNCPHMAEDVLVVLMRVVPLVVGDDCVHPVLGRVVVFDEVCPHGGGDHVGDVGVALGEVGREVHLLPAETLLELLHPGEAEVAAHALPSHEINCPV